MYYSIINPCDMVNGEGIRVSLFVSGCSFNCKGCFNKEAQNYRYGKEFTDKALYELTKAVDQDNISGLSILGGEPLAPKNREKVFLICRHIKQVLPHKTIWIWTGYTYEEVSQSISYLLQYIDVLVDGRYEERLKDPSLKWRGSSNQRIINVKESKMA